MITFIFYQTIRTMRTKRILMWDIIQDLMLWCHIWGPVLQLNQSLLSHELSLFFAFLSVSLIFRSVFILFYSSYLSRKSRVRPIFKGLRPLPSFESHIICKTVCKFPYKCYQNLQIIWNRIQFLHVLKSFGKVFNVCIN